MRISGCIISIVLLLVAIPSLAQVDSVIVNNEEIKNEEVKIKNRFLPTGLRVGIDLISLGQGIKSRGLSALTKGEIRQVKFSADIDFYRYFLNFEYGHFDRQWDDPNFGYRSKGTFYKIGPDINFLHRDEDQSALFFGLRYAWSNYSDNMYFNYTNTFWGDNALSAENVSLTSHWLELTTGLKVKLYKFIWTGYTARLKFQLNENYANNPLAPYWIPGYGRAQEESRWGFDYYLIIRIPFRKYIPAEKKDK